MAPTAFDIDLLRTFVAIADCGGFARAGERVHRTQSTVSLQMKRLEARAGTDLFRREGRAMVLTDAGDQLLRYARRILALSDEAAAAIEGGQVAGPVRIGTIQDLSEEILPRVLGQFAQSHPEVRLELQVDSSARLQERIHEGHLDIAVTLVPEASGDSLRLRREVLVWIAGDGFRLPRDEPLPLVLCEVPCGMRALAISALEDAGRPWRIAVSTPSLSGLRSAVRANLGVTARGTSVLDSDLRALGPADGLPDLPTYDVCLSLRPGASSVAIQKMAELLTETLAERASAARP